MDEFLLLCPRSMVMSDTEKQCLLDGIEALYPADASCPRAAFVGQVLLNYALENASYNWRDLPKPVLAFYLAICEDYESQVAGKHKKDNLPRYLKN